MITDNLFWVTRTLFFPAFFYNQNKLSVIMTFHITGIYQSKTWKKSILSNALHWRQLLQISTDDGFVIYNVTLFLNG